MVHALAEVRRTLKTNGVLIDLRPLEDRWPVEVTSGQGFTELARLTDLPLAIADDRAATAAMGEAEALGWFVRKAEAEFAFFYYWDTPSEMLEFMQTEWEGIEKLDDASFAAVGSAWATADADARIRIRVKMLITEWV